MTPAEKTKVLIIDDELGPRESLRILLNREFTVFCAESVDEGLRVLRDQRPAVIVTDIRMPGKNGIDGLKEIRRQDPLVSVIMLTGFGALETAQEALRHGANDYLKKPFDAPEMLALIRKHVHRTELERRSEKARLELKDLNSRLMEKLTQNEHLASLGQMSAEFLHDLRNPLTIVLGYVQLLSEQLNTVKDRLGGQFGETVEYLDVIEKNVQRCHELAQMWQSYGKSDLNRYEPTAIGKLIQDIVVGVQPLVDGQKARIDCKLNQNGAMIMGSRPQLLRAIHNVVSNAIQAVANDGSGKIQISCAPEGENLRLDIEDNGSGMTPEQLAKAFDAYFTTKPTGKGTGLGLYITRKIIEEHNGRIEMESEKGKGTRVHVQLPLLRDKPPSTSAA